MDLVTAGEVVALIIGVGGASAVVVKGGKALRRFGHFVDKLAGDGDKEPGILARLESLKDDGDALKADTTELKEKGNLRDEQITELTTAVKELGVKIDNHVDGDAVQWKADGEAWGNRLEAHLTDHDDRIAALERPGDTQDPVAGANPSK